MCSAGSACLSARTTVRPPKPESNTPSGASARSSMAGSRTKDPNCGSPVIAPLRIAGADDQLEECHAHRDARFDLIEDDALYAVGDGRLDLDAPIDRSRVHDDGVRLGERQHPRAQSKGARILTRARD